MKNQKIHLSSQAKIMAMETPLQKHYQIKKAT